MEWWLACNGAGLGWLNPLQCVGHPHASDSVPTRMPVEPVVPPLRQHCWIDHLFTAKRWRDGNVPRWERRAGQFVFTLGLLCRGQQASPVMHPSELVGLEDPEGPFRSYYWDFEIGGGKNVSKIQTNLGNGFHLLLRTPVSFLYVISFILQLSREMWVWVPFYTREQEVK